MKLKTTRERRQHEANMLREWHMRDGQKVPFGFLDIIEDCNALEDELARVREELGLTQRTAERIIFERDKLREELESARRIYAAAIELCDWVDDVMDTESIEGDVRDKTTDTIGLACAEHKRRFGGRE